MKVLPAQTYRKSNLLTFKGQEYYFSNNTHNGKNLTTEMNNGLNRGNENLVASGHPNPYATIEKVNHARVGYGVGMGVYPPIYWADPMENLSDTKRGNYNFIVYDNEPPFPELEKDIQKKFFGELKEAKKDYIQEYTVVRDYFARLEEADTENLKNLKKNKNNISSSEYAEKYAFYQARINDAKHKQFLAEECRRLYTEAEPILRIKSVHDYTLLQLRQHSIDNVESQIKEYEDFLAKFDKAVAPIKEQIKFYQNKIGCYKTVLKLNDANTPLFCADENLFILDKLKDLKGSLKYKKHELKEEYKKATELKHKIVALQEYIRDYPKKMQEVQTSRQAVMRELLPIFEKLKTFYIKQGIKVRA